MTIAEQIKASLKQARLGKDERTKNVIGMLKAKLTNELKSGKGLEENDELWLKVLASYAKELGKSMEKYRELGERGAEPLADAQFELDYCQQFLPTKLDEARTEELVKKIAADNGIDDAKQMGKLMGLIMKSHRDEVDGNLVRQVAQRVLGG
jgi:uncharacterized protein YqeY